MKIAENIPINVKTDSKPRREGDEDGQFAELLQKSTFQKDNTKIAENIADDPLNENSTPQKSGKESKKDTDISYQAIAQAFGIMPTNVHDILIVNDQTADETATTELNISTEGNTSNTTKTLPPSISPDLVLQTKAEEQTVMELPEKTNDALVQKASVLSKEVEASRNNQNAKAKSAIYSADSVSSSSKASSEQQTQTQNRSGTPELDFGDQSLSSQPSSLEPTSEIEKDFVKITKTENAAQTKQGKESDDKSGASLQAMPTLMTSEAKTIRISDASSQIGQPVGRQIAQAALKNLNNGISEFKMDLYPKDLGQIKVKMQSKDGLLTVELSALNPKTQNLLSANADSIRSLLQPANEKQVIVSCYAQEQSGYQNADRQSGDSGTQQQRQQGQAQQNTEEEKLPDTVDFISFIQQMKQMQVSAF